MFLGNGWLRKAQGRWTVQGVDDARLDSPSCAPGSSAAIGVQRIRIRKETAAGHECELPLSAPLRVTLAWASTYRFDIICGRTVGDERRSFQFLQSQRWTEAAVAGA
jgi:hypothetical protein